MTSHFIQKQPPEKFHLKNASCNISQNSQENTCVWVSFSIKLQAEACNFFKRETLAQAFSCEFCKIFTNTFFTDNLRTTTSEFYFINKIFLCSFQKQPPEVFCKKDCSQKFRKIHRKTTVPEPLLIGLRTATLSKRNSGTGVFLRILQNL